ncbi:MAG: hypothetical protein HYI21_13775 [Sediminibacterium sp. Gen4]|jgi:hypothetical protein|uniref:hypothetical protein n=1 Tax=unclassified Sediminibacterium TaxID=2635961 RepID=UPI0015B9B132|nr:MULTISPECIES: hypothetical protein [unclassified Sediminibacterium]MBW0160384.1 hypothetical protein [Sediminibacterium sp.]MBW0163675.1 hypothetical protein [Sediminibacterium sp.]NWK67091.1 hypothetical protein [Sediminibacterium sp. Gen4]
MSLPGNKKKVDVIDKVLEACYQYNKDALFVMSLMHQYEERGSLSKKQLEGLVAKARKVPDMPVGWLAAVEAIILKMPTRDKTPVDLNKQVATDPYEKWIDQCKEILQRYPGHKRVVYFDALLQQRKPFSSVEQQELEKFYRLLIEGKK